MISYVSSGKPYSPYLTEQKKKELPPPGYDKFRNGISVSTGGTKMNLRSSGKDVIKNPFFKTLLDGMPHAKINKEDNNPFFGKAESNVGSHSIPSVFRESPTDESITKPFGTEGLVTVGNHKLEKNLSSIKDSRVKSNPKKGFNLYSSLDQLSVTKSDHIRICK